MYFIEYVLVAYGWLFITQIHKYLFFNVRNDLWKVETNLREKEEIWKRPWWLYRMHIILWTFLAFNVNFYDILNNWIRLQYFTAELTNASLYSFISVQTEFDGKEIKVSICPLKSSWHFLLVFLKDPDEEVKMHITLLQRL